MSVLVRLRRFWLDVHLWLGVGLLIPFTIIAVTGSILVWHEPLERMVEPHRYSVSEGAPLPLSASLQSARGAFGDQFVATAVRAPAEAGDPVVVQARAKGRPQPGQRPETRSAWVDPATGRVLDVANTRADAFGIMHVLHGSLMIPQNGRAIVGGLGVAMLLSSLTGLWLWWPRGAFLKGFRWKRGPRTTYNLHHFTGWLVVIPLAALAFTGAYISFPQFSRAALAAVTGAPAPQQQGGGGGGGGPGGGGQPLARTQLSVDDAAQAARAVAPDDARIVSITLPTRSRNSDAPPNWRVQIQVPGQEAMSAIVVNDETGAARANPAPGSADNVARLMRRLHDGTETGLFWQIVITIAGFAPVLFGYTGVWMWLRRRAARRAIRRGHQAPVEPVPQAAE